MKHCILLAVFVIAALVCSIETKARPPQSEQAIPQPAVQSPHATEADRQALLEKASHGDAGSQFLLGTAYEQGWFGRSDYHAALIWLRKSAARGNPDAQVSLGQMYEDGEGVERNYSQAAKWFRKASEHVPDHGGAGQGRNNLGLLYLNGWGVPRDYVQACMWFILANVKENESYAQAQMTPTQIEEAERMASEWRRRHSTP